MIYLLIKEQRTNGGFSRTTVKAFVNPDIAKLVEVKCNYYAETFTKYFIDEVRLNETEELFIKREDGKVVLEDEHNEPLEVDVSLEVDTDEYGTSVIIDKLSFYDERVDNLGLTPELFRQIENEAENIKDEAEERRLSPMDND